MARLSALIYATVGAIIAEAVVWAVVLPWAHYRYTTGIVVGLSLWKPILIIALVGGGIGLAVFAAKRALGSL
jgi:hypothetical protein